MIVGLALYTALGVALMTVGQLLVGLERVNALALSLVLCALAIIGSSIVVAPRWGLTGIALCMAGSKVVTYWPIQLRELRRIFRETQVSAQATVTEPARSTSDEATSRPAITMPTVKLLLARVSFATMRSKPCRSN